MSVQIFIPTFNRSEKLSRAIRSALSQTFKEIEVVILDNHSEDDTQEVVAAFKAIDHRITYIRREHNIGMNKNFNAIRTLVTANYFSVLTDDDEYESCFIKTAMTCFESDSRIKFVACNAPTLINGELLKSQLDTWTEGFYRANTSIFKCISGQYPLVTNCLMSAEIANDFIFHQDLGNVGDGLFFTCIFSKYDAYVSKVTTGYWNNDGQNASSLYQADPVTLVNYSIRESRHYKNFCQKNHIFMRGLLLLWLKKFLTVLVASNQSNFQHVRNKSEMKEVFSLSEVAALWVLDKLKFIHFFLQALSMFRRVNVFLVSLQEKK